MSEHQNMDCWKDLSYFEDYSKPLLLHGPPGVQKTSWGASQAADGQVAIQMTFTEDTSNTDLWGYDCPDGKGSTRWHSGPGLIAWRMGLPIVLNEVNRAGDSALTALYALLDDPEIAQTTLTNGEFVQPTAGFRGIGTMNGSYNTLPEGLLDRFTTKVWVNRPMPAAIESINAVPLRTLLETSYNEYAKSGGKASLIVTFREVKVHDENITRGVPESVSGRTTWGNRWDAIRTAIRTESPSYEADVGA